VIAMKVLWVKDAAPAMTISPLSPAVPRADQPS